MTNWPAALDLLREAGARMLRLGPETSLREALQLIADTATKLMGSEAAAVIYTYDAARGAFDPTSRVSAGERVPILGDVPRPDGVGALALRTRRRVLSYESGLPFHPLKREAGIHTSACYPLLVSDQPVGALYVDLREARTFTDDELLLLDAFVPLSAVAIYNTRQFDAINRALQRKVDELEQLRRAEQLISSRSGLDETLAEILRSAVALTGAEYGSFRLLDKPAGLLRLRASYPGPTSPALSRDISVDEPTSVMAWVARHRQSALIADTRRPPWSDVYVPLHPELEMRSELAVPMLGPGGGVEGVLNVESPRPRAFEAEHQRLLETLATQAVIALQEAKLLAALEAITGKLVSHSPDELLGLLIQRALDLLNVPHAAVWEFDADPAYLRLRAANITAVWPDYRVPLEGSFLGQAVLTRRPVYSADLPTDPRIKRRRLVDAMKWVSGLAVPLIGREGAPLGAFSVYTQALREFSDWETRLLTSLANHAAVAFQQAEALTQIKLAQERQAVAETFAVLGDVAANLIHRINNMVGVIPQLVEGLKEKRPDLLDDPFVKKKLTDIEGSARKAMTAARETFAGIRPFPLRAVSVLKCYEAAAARAVRPECIRLRARGLSKLPAVSAAEEQLQLVLFNLIENAVDAIGECKGRITVSGRVVADALDPDRSWVELSIADDGPGVPPEFRERIFDASFTTKNSGRKMGFGLWWVKSWVQRFGGSIRLAEPNPAARGCTFIIRLPVAAEPAEK
ncbi:MAG: GAF domain-containing protein [Anaerolineales bacterium]|nr:GAF domain-containing protein [Anaerolineales bacterium]